MSDDSQEEPIIFPHLAGHDRKLCESAIRQLQTRGVIANFSGTEDLDETELYAWSQRNLPLLEAYFQFSGLGVRAQQGFPIIQLVLEDGEPSHPLRRRLDKAATGLLICLWVMYHERMAEVDGFLVPVSVGDVYARLAALYRTGEIITDGLFKEAVRRFERYGLVQADWLPDEFSQSRLGLLPTLLTTFRFQDAAEARQWVASSDTDNDPDLPPS